MHITLTLPQKLVPKVRAINPDPRDEDAPVVIRFAKQVVRTVVKTVKSFIRDCYQHTEAIILLVLASVGLNYLLQQVPMAVAMPFWIEAAMVIPVISVICIQLLTWSATTRAKRRANP